MEPQRLRLIRAITEELAEHRDQPWLCLGANAKVAREFTTSYPPLIVVAADTQKSINKFRKRCPSPRLIGAHAHQLPFKPRSLDCLILFNPLDSNWDLDVLISSWSDWLKPQGKMMLVEHARSDRARAHLSKLLLTAGFQFIKQRPLLGFALRPLVLTWGSYRELAPSSDLP